MLWNLLSSHGRRIGRQIKSPPLVSSFVALLLLVWLLIPPVWKLRSKSIHVIRWLPESGKTYVSVGPDQPSWTEIHRISKHTLDAVTTSEDARFYQHSGLDFNEIQSSIRLNMRRKKYARGASTITQQVVKVAFLSQQKNLIRKIREAAGALLLERILEKNQILAWYLNLVEFGEGVYGLRQAADHYFGTKPELLTSAQSIHLALVLPSPNAWSRGLRDRNLTDFGHRRFYQIATNMLRSGTLTEVEWQTTLATGNFGSPIRYPPKPASTPVHESDQVQVQKDEGFDLHMDEDEVTEAADPRTDLDSDKKASGDPLPETRPDLGEIVEDIENDTTDTEGRD